MFKKTKHLGIVFVVSMLLITASLIKAQVADENKDKKYPRIQIVDHEVQILDADGKVKKQISLKDESKIEDDTVTTIVKGKKVSQRIRFKKQLTKYSVLSSDNRRLIFITNNAEAGFIDEKGIQRDYNEWKWGTGKIAFLDEAGTVLWEKQFKKYHKVEKAVIANNNEMMAVIVSCYDRYSLEPQEPYGVLHVINKEGQEIFIWPKDNSKYRAFMSDNPIFSPNGRYLSVVADSNDYERTTIYFDLKNKTVWDTEIDYVAYKISDDGLAHVGRNAIGQEKNIDLRTYLGD